MKLSIVIPAYNEEERIKNTLDSYHNFFSKEFGKNFEIIVIVNGSDDRTQEVVKSLSFKYKQIKFKNFPDKIGKGGAIIEGFKIAYGDLIGFVDADMATTPVAFYDLIRNLGNYDGVVASRWIKGAKIDRKQPISRRIASRGFNIIVRLLFNVRIRDTQCVHGSTEIFGYLNGNSFRDKIQNLANHLRLRVNRKRRDYVIYEVLDELLVPSLGSDNKPELAKVTSLVIRFEKKKLYEIKTDGGRYTQVSEDHPILTYKNNNLEYRKAKYINKDQKIPVLINLNKKLFPYKIDKIDIIHELKKNFSSDLEKFIIHNWLKNSKSKTAKELVDILDIPYYEAHNYVKNNRIPLNYLDALHIRSKNSLKVSYYGGKIKIPVIIKADNNLMRLIGYFLAEGCIDKHDGTGVNRYNFRLSFNKNEGNLILEGKQLLSKIFGIKSSIYIQNNVTVISAHSRILCIFFKHLLDCGTNATDKRIPYLVYSLSETKIGNLLDAYLLGDGHISKHKLANSVVISANSASVKLIKDIQFLLLKLGVNSSIYRSSRGNEYIGSRRLNSSYGFRWNLNVHLGANSLKLLRYTPMIFRMNQEIIKSTRGVNPSLFYRTDRKFNHEIGLVKVAKITRNKVCSEWYDFKVQSRENPNMNFVHDCGMISHNCGAKLLTKNVVKSVVNDLGITQWGFDVDLLYRLKKKNFKVKEIPTVWNDREGSKLKIGRTSWQMFLSVARLRLIYSRFKFIVNVYDKVHDYIYKK